MNPAALKTNLDALKPGGLVIVDSGEFYQAQPREGQVRRQSARRRQPRQMAGARVRHQRADDRGGQGLRPRQQGRAALQEHVDAGPGAVDVRPRPPAADRLAQGQVQEGARTGRGQHRRAQRRARLWRDGRAFRPAQADAYPAGPERAGALPHDHRGRSGFARARRRGAAGRAAAVLRRLSDHPGLARSCITWCG